MKARFDFVSNSSSTSFVLLLPKPIEEYDRKEFRKLFRRNDKRITDQIYDNVIGCSPKYSYNITDMELALNINEEYNLIESKDNSY